MRPLCINIYFNQSIFFLSPEKHITSSLKHMYYMEPVGKRGFLLSSCVYLLFCSRSFTHHHHLTYSRTLPTRRENNVITTCTLLCASCTFLSSDSPSMLPHNHQCDRYNTDDRTNQHTTPPIESSSSS